ncbi:MAG TPA: BPSS1780 family membrane protein [Gammaproteobacteria bacterium]|nr:BPSS1780 family membrane protein [Gammaproteobacteria bacterium]
MSENPYQAPEAALEAEPGAFAGDVQEPQRVRARRGAAWLGRSVTLFRSSWGTWVAMLLVTGLLMFALALIPLLNLAASVAMPIFFGGFMLAAHRIATTGSSPVGTLIDGFRYHFGGLAGVGVVALLGVVVYVAVVFGTLYAMGIGPGMEAGEMDPQQAERIFQVMPLATLGGMALNLPFVMATLFAPALVAIHGVDLLAALRMSFTACLRNVLPFLVLGLVLIGIGIGVAVVVGLLSVLHPVVGLLAYLLALLVLAPLITLTIYTAHADIFLGPEPA